MIAFVRACTSRADRLLFIGSDPLNTLAGILLKRLGLRRFRSIVYYSVDYSPVRFKSGLLNRIYHWIDRMAVKGSDAVWNVSQRMRQIRQQMARRSVRKAVPDADVIINNPEHYAVAVRYDSSKAAAPYVVAKGIDEMAAYIRSVAREHQVPQLELPPLARALYNGTQVQQQIPASLYEAVAQVLHHVMQLQAFRSGRRQTEPRLDADLQVPRHLSDPDTP